MRMFVLLMILVVFPAAPSRGEIKVVGTGETMRLDPAGFPPEMKASYALMETKCRRCHSLERTILAVTTGVAPLSGRPFNRDAVQIYGQKMLRKPDTRMTRQDVQSVVELLTFLVENNKQTKGAH